MPSVANRVARLSSGTITMPHEEVRDYFYQRQNYLHDLDTAAEDLTAGMRIQRGELAGEIVLTPGPSPKIQKLNLGDPQAD